MSKSLGNAIGIQEPPQEMYGKLMSISDDLMWRYWTLLTDLRQSEIDTMRNDVVSGTLHPMEAKKRLARTIVADFHSAEASQQADEVWGRQFQQRDVEAISREVEVDLRQVAIADAVSLQKILGDPNYPVHVHMGRLLVALGFSQSRTAADKQVKAGVRVDGAKSAEINLLIPSRPARIPLEVGRQKVIAVFK
jgi:tyrosyl-tRNA synthetase